jgi:hypothetical protein
VSDVSASDVETGSDRARVASGTPAMKGTMLWFDEAKHYGFVLTEDGHRLRVEREWFIDSAAPVGRCAGRPVNLSVAERDGERIAVDVSLIADVSPRRARRRSSSIRSGWS